MPSVQTMSLDVEQSNDVITEQVVAEEMPVQRKTTRSTRKTKTTTEQ